MASFYSKSDPFKLFVRRLILLCLLLLLIAAGAGVWSAFRKSRESALLNVQAQTELQDLADRQRQLTKEVAKLNTARGKEEALREQYALAAQGEGVIIIVDQKENKPVHATSTFRSWLHRVFPWW